MKFLRNSFVLLLTCGSIISYHSFSQEVSYPEVDMVSDRIRLSYVNPSRCIQLLQLYGVRVDTALGPIDRSKLPVVVALPETKFHETIPDHEKVFPQTETDPINELLLFYDCADPVSAGKIRKIVNQYIDLPARKIMIEAMVLEISSASLEELGVEWDFNSGKEGVSGGNFVNQKLDGANDSLILGKIKYPSAGSAQLDATLTNVFNEFNIRLQALVEEGSAQILSRPSVLTLDNRMACLLYTSDAADE